MRGRPGPDPRGETERQCAPDHDSSHETDQRETGTEGRDESHSYPGPSSPSERLTIAPDRKRSPGAGAFGPATSRASVLTDAEGVTAVRLARRSLEEALGAPRSDPALLTVPDSWSERRGAFVTWKEYPSGELRGCIGFPLPVRPLARAIPEASLAAALEDPRFPPVRADELRRLTVEVSALTVPVEVPRAPPADMIRAVVVGRDGLIVDGHGTSGLLLPQVAPEQGWSAEELFEGTCEKAGLPPRAWRDASVHVRRFEAEVFHERSPGGPVERAVTVTAADGRPARRR